MYLYLHKSTHICYFLPLPGPLCLMLTLTAERQGSSGALLCRALCTLVTYAPWAPRSNVVPTRANPGFFLLWLSIYGVNKRNTAFYPRSGICTKPAIQLDGRWTFDPFRSYWRLDFSLALSVFIPVFILLWHTPLVQFPWQKYWGTYYENNSE